MQEVRDIATTINAKIGKLKSGSLQFYGEWFGRPMDNCHTITGADCDGEILQVYFDDGESLSVWAPESIEIGKNTFSIEAAWKVRWEWFYYGFEKTKENRYFLEYTASPEIVSGSTNVNWYNHVFTATLNSPAVIMS